MIIKFVKSLGVVAVGAVIIAALLVAASVIINLLGIEVAFLEQAAVWVLSMVSKALVWLYNIIMS